MEGKVGSQQVYQGGLCAGSEERQLGVFVLKASGEEVKVALVGGKGLGEEGSIEGWATEGLTQEADTGGLLD